MQMHSNHNNNMNNNNDPYIHYNYLKSNNNLIRNLIQNHRIKLYEQRQRENLNEILILKNPTTIELDNNHNDENYLSQSEDDFVNRNDNVFIDDREEDIMTTTTTTTTSITTNESDHETYQHTHQKHKYFNRLDSKRCNLSYSLSTSSTDLSRNILPKRPHMETSEKTSLQKSTNSLIRTLQNKWTSFENHLNQTEPKLDSRQSSMSQLIPNKKPKNGDSIKSGLVESMKKRFLNSTPICPYIQPKDVHENHLLDLPPQAPKYHKIGNVNLNYKNYNYYNRQPSSQSSSSSQLKQQQQQQRERVKSPPPSNNIYLNRTMSLSIDEHLNGKNLLNKMLNNKLDSLSRNNNDDNDQSSSQLSREPTSTSLSPTHVQKADSKIDELHERIKREMSELRKDDEFLTHAFDQIRNGIQEVTNTLKEANKVQYADDVSTISAYSSHPEEITQVQTDSLSKKESPVNNSKFTLCPNWLNMCFNKKKKCESGDEYAETQV